MLNQYLAITQSLIQTPASPVPLITAALLTQYINLARGQIAAQGECVPAIGAINTTAGISGYQFTTIQFSPADAPMIKSAIAIRMINLVTATGQRRVVVREWPWFNNYIIAKPVENTGPPKVWTQYRQGSPEGVIFINIPDQAYALAIDAVCIPIDLVDDTTPEILPYLWTDAVPFYAAWYAFMAFQRQADADHMLERYTQMMGRARSGVTPGVLPGTFPQGPDPMLANRLGGPPHQGGGQQRGARPTAPGG